MHTIATYLFCLCSLSFYTGCAQVNNPKSLPETITPVQDDSIKLEARIAGVFQHFEVDVLNNIYLITPTNQLKKVNANGDSVAVYNNVKKFGNPTLVDVSNPLKVLLYYKNFSTVAILDRFLSQRNTINFRQQNIFTVRAIATSYDNNIWLFDEQDFKLKKIDELGKVLQESTDWRQMMDNVPLPQTIVDAENYVYLYDPAKGFYIFDRYNTFRNNLPFTGWENINVSGKRLSGFKNNRFVTYELESLNLREYPLPATFRQAKSIRTMNGKIYVLREDGIEIYTLL